MRNFIERGKRSILIFFLLSIMAPAVFAHGGEDHGDAQPKTTSSEKGTILHSTRMGDYELVLKYPVPEPDTATTGRLFVTRYQTNEPDGQAVALVEIESANGSVVQADVEKTDQSGVFVVRFPALPQGEYTIRAKLTYSGETDTALFAGVRVAHEAAASADGGVSLARTALIGVVFALVLVLFGVLVYFVWRFAGDAAGAEETVST